MDKNGEIVEEIPSPLQDINAVGVLNYQFVIKNNQQLLQADDDVIDWYDIESDKVSWATQSALLTLLNIIGVRVTLIKIIYLLISLREKPNGKIE